MDKTTDPERAMTYLVAWDTDAGAWVAGCDLFRHLRASAPTPDEALVELRIAIRAEIDRESSPAWREYRSALDVHAGDEVRARDINRITFRVDNDATLRQVVAYFDEYEYRRSGE